MGAGPPPVVKALVTNIVKVYFMLFCPFTSVLLDTDAMRLLGLTESQLTQNEEDGSLVRTGTSENIILAEKNLISFSDLLRLKLCLELKRCNLFSSKTTAIVDIIVDSLYYHLDRTSACPEIEITTNYHNALNEIKNEFFEELSETSDSIDINKLGAQLIETALKTFKSLCCTVSSEIMAAAA